MGAIGEPATETDGSLPMTIKRFLMAVAAAVAAVVCTTSNAQCPGLGGDCCTANGTPGCNDVPCCNTVCGLDAFCCSTSWDSLCANLAIANCGALCAPPPPPPACGPGAGDCCSANATAGCDDIACCAAVCAADPFCCNFGWDGACASLAVNTFCVALCATPAACGDPGTGDCCAANGSPFCDDAACCTLVCAGDPFCCTTNWDGLCAADAQALCGICPPPPPPPACGVPGTGDCFSANGTPFCDCGPCCDVVCALDPFCCTSNWDSICAGIAATNCTGPVLTLVANDTCIDGNDTLTISVVLTNLACDPAAGFQAFLTFDDTALTFAGGAYTALPFGLPVLDPIVAVGNQIDLASGIDLFSGQAPFAGSATLATLDFVANNDDCAGSTVAFRPAFPPTRLTFLGGGEIPGLVTVDSAPIIVDTTDPVFTSTPADISVPADAGFCSAVVTITPATADDNCGTVNVTGVRSDSLPLSAPYPSGITQITWTAVDPCGNSATHVQNVEVMAFSELVLTVELQGMIAAGPFDRCIDLELFGCPGGTIVSTNVTFTGGSGTVTILVPCTAVAYDCATAGDPLHTLRSTSNVSVSGTQYVASFTGGAALRGGNADGNEYIDILDFGVFAAQFNTAVGADTPCSTAGPNADFNGDGFVDMADFTFIQINFLAFDQPDCGCPLPMEGWVREGRSMPVERISVADLRRMGRPELAAADLNGDGWLDVQDMVLFMLQGTP